MKFCAGTTFKPTQISPYIFLKDTFIDTRFTQVKRVNQNLLLIHV